MFEVQFHEVGYLLLNKFKLKILIVDLKLFDISYCR